MTNNIKNIDLLCFQGLIVNNDILNKDRLLKYIDILIIKDENINQNAINETILRLETILNNRRFIA